MTQAESRVSRGIIDALHARKIFAWKVHGSPLTPAGLPDIVACVEGYFLGFETKMPGKRGNVSEVQKLRHEQIRLAGGEVFVVCGVKEALVKLDEWLAGKRSTKQQINALESLRSERARPHEGRVSRQVLDRQDGEVNGLDLAISVLKGEI